MLTLLAMERCRTAREAIRLMGGLAEKYGYGFVDGGEMLAVADPKEVWIFEIMPVGPLWTPESGKPGAVWCAQRVPDDEVSVCPNESRIGEIDLDNKDFFLASPNVVSCAVEQKLYDPASGKPFNWKRAYSPAEGSALSSDGRRQRMWRFYDLVAPSQKFNADTPEHGLPLLGQARQEALRPGRHGPDPGQDPTARSSIRSRASAAAPSRIPTTTSNTRKISVANAEYTTVTQCRAGSPTPSAASSGCPGAPRTRPATCPSTPA